VSGTATATAAWINELIIGVNIALGNASPAACTAMDANQDGRVTINELIAAVNAALNGCTAAPTQTAMSTVTPSEPMITVTGSCAGPWPGDAALRARALAERDPRWLTVSAC
jgi:hypothetical protein